MASRKNLDLDAALATVQRARAELPSDGAKEALRQALAHRNWLVVSEAAKVVGDLAVDELKDALLGVFPRFVENAVKVDPGCRAKEAALTALDRLESLDPEPFLAAVRYRQPEPSLGRPVDTAGGLRVRALSALLRLLHPDAVLYAAELLADEDAQVRVGSAHALGYYGNPTSAGLLVYKLRIGDEDPVVISEAAAGLLALAPEFALPFLKSWLNDRDATVRESAALVLAQSRHAEAVAMLIEWVGETALEADFAIGASALSHSRAPAAREYLLEQIATASPGRARLAEDALRVHAYDEQLQKRVAEALARNARLTKASKR